MIGGVVLSIALVASAFSKVASFHNQRTTTVATTPISTATATLTETATNFATETEANIKEMLKRFPSVCRLTDSVSVIISGEDSSNSNDFASIAKPFADIDVVDPVGSDASDPSKTTTMTTHVIVLIHGWMGNPAEMSYIRESIQRAAARASARCASESSTKVKHRHRFVLHSPSCNEDRTDDGIAMGGSRLAQEINDLVRHVVERENERVGGESNKSEHKEAKINCNSNCNSNSNTPKQPSDKITLSIVGNSLGGLYARHALAGIDWQIKCSSGGEKLKSLVPMVFVTTATPHLGISQHTYIPLPRAAEFVVAQGMKETGRDFFRFTRVLEDLFCKDYFLDPLSSFRKRIAYINVYGTDFQVPTATAAFWAQGSDSPHYKVVDDDNKDSDDTSNGNDSGAANTTKKNDSGDAVADSDLAPTPKAIVMKLSTPRRLDLLEEGKASEGDTTTTPAQDTPGPSEDRKNNDNKDDLDDDAHPSEVYGAWSKRLDRLGWTKVLVDVRENVPGVSVSVPSPTDGEEGDANNSDSIPEEESGSEDQSKNGEKQPGEKTKLELPENNNNNNNNNKKNNRATNNSNDPANESKTEDCTNESDAKIPDWTTKDTWTAGELLTQFKGGLMTVGNKKPKGLYSMLDLKARLPLGHTVMIANSKDEFNKKVTAGGKPVMDYLASSLVQALREP